MGQLAVLGVPAAPMADHQEECWEEEVVGGPHRQQAPCRPNEAGDKFKSRNEQKEQLITKNNPTTKCPFTSHPPCDLIKSYRLSLGSVPRTGRRFPYAQVRQAGRFGTHPTDEPKARIQAVM